MKKIICSLFLFLVTCLAIGQAEAAIQIKKATPVATKSSGGTSGAASLVPSIIGLVSGVIEMNAKQNALSAECIPTSAEMTFVENTMKEYAKTGAVSATALETTLGRERCEVAAGCYALQVSSINGVEGLKPKYDSFVGVGNENMIWHGFPKPGKGFYCKSGVPTCTGKDRIDMSDAYDIFNLIDFGPADYLPGETTMAAKLLNKVETCSTAKLNARKRALWGEFLINTASTVGQKTNTGSIMQSVQGIAGGGGAGALSSISGIASQFLAK